MRKFIKKNLVLNKFTRIITKIIIKTFKFCKKNIENERLSQRISH